MKIPPQLESLCNRALLSIRYENASPDDCFPEAAAHLSDADKETLLAFLDSISDEGVATEIVAKAVNVWAHRFGMKLDSNAVQWLLSARSALEAKTSKR